MKVLFLSLIFLVQFSAWSSEAFIKAYAGKVTIDGKVITKNSTQIKAGSVVEAIGIKSTVDIKFSNGHVIRIRNGKTIIKIIKENKTILEHLKGSLFNVVNKLRKSGEFEVITKNGSLGVRGTMFMVKEDEKETYLCVCEGVVRSKVGKKEFDVKADFDQFLRAGKELEAPLKANSQMMTMATSEFELMGHPVK